MSTFEVLYPMSLKVLKDLYPEPGSIVSVFGPPDWDKDILEAILETLGQKPDELSPKVDV